MFVIYNKIKMRSASAMNDEQNNEEFEREDNGIDVEIVNENKFSLDEINNKMLRDNWGTLLDFLQDGSTLDNLQA